MSKHGKWISYAPGNLYCDDQTAEENASTSVYPFGGTPGDAPTNCTATSGASVPQLNVDSFPASGDHANYPVPDQTTRLSETSNNGLESWGGNLNDSALIPFPETAGAPENFGTSDEISDWTGGPENWSDWPGNWGATIGSGLIDPDPETSPCSPAALCSPDHGNYFFAPWRGKTTMSPAVATGTQATHQTERALTSRRRRREPQAALAAVAGSARAWPRWSAIEPQWSEA
jgi:hypothetical protein